MENQNQYLHEVAVTAFIMKDGKYLICRRLPSKKRFPGMWVAPGGKMETNDYLQLPKDTKDWWYNVLERTLKRETREEVGININNIEYLTSAVTIYVDGTPSLLISCLADYVDGEISLQKEELDDYAWVNLDEAKNYNLIDGIYDELVMAENLRNGRKSEWQRF